MADTYTKFSDLRFTIAGLRVLVIEDEPRMAQLLHDSLSEQGHSVTVSLDGREGVGIAESWTFDLILLDVMLPGMDGFAIVRRLQSDHNRTIHCSRRFAYGQPCRRRWQSR